MGWPQFSRAILCGDLDSEGQPLICGCEYDLEWLRPQLCWNGSFEFGYTGWTVDPGSAVLTIDFAEHYQGGKSASITWDGLGDTWSMRYTRRNLPIRLDRTYLLRAMVKSAPGQTINWKLGVEWLDAAGAAVPSVTGSEDHEHAANSWARYESEFTPPAGAVYARPYVAGVDGEPFNGWLDVVQFLPSLDEEHEIAGVWTEDEPTFTILKAGDEHTVTFNTLPFAPSPITIDDPVDRLAIGDLLIERRRRQQQRTNVLDFSFLPWGYGEALEIFHRNSRGQRFTYTDAWGIDHEVCWAQPFTRPQIPGADPPMVGCAITLTEYL